jgi:hypothetical protein
VPTQRCTVHKHRNLLAHAPDALHDEVSADYADMIYGFRAARCAIVQSSERPPEAELKHLPDVPVVELSPMLKDFADTAAAVAALDLIIMTDSSVAHLAGALGTPVWVLVNFGAYWLWHEERNDSPWYDSLRLFRAKTWNDWAGVFDAASAVLSRLAAEHRRDVARRAEFGRDIGIHPYIMTPTTEERPRRISAARRRSSRARRTTSPAATCPGWKSNGNWLRCAAIWRLSSSGNKNAVPRAMR